MSKVACYELQIRIGFAIAKQRRSLDKFLRLGVLDCNAKQLARSCGVSAENAALVAADVAQSEGVPQLSKKSYYISNERCGDNAGVILPLDTITENNSPTHLWHVESLGGCSGSIKRGHGGKIINATAKRVLLEIQT